MAKQKSGATLASVQSSMGEDVTHNLHDIEEVSAPVVTHFTEAPKPKKQSVIFKLKSGGSRRLYMDNEADMYCPESKGIRRARLIRGVSTIWMDEQKDVSKEYAERNAVELCFEYKGNKSYLIVPVLDKTTIQFLRLHPANADVPEESKIKYYHFTFEEHDVEKIANEKEKFARMEDEAYQKALTASEEYIRKHAVFLGVRFVDEFGEPLPQKEIAYEYRRKAKSNPELFLKTFNSFEVDVTYAVKKGISKSLFNIVNGKVYLAFDSSFVCAVAPNARHDKAIIDFAMQKTEDSVTFLEKLKQALSLHS